MNPVLVVLIIFLLLGGGLALFAVLGYSKITRRAKAIERGLKMVPILIHLPPPADDTDGQGRDSREVMREKISQAQILYELISSTATEGFKSKFYGQRHIAFEIIAHKGLIHYYAAVPVAMVSLVQKAILTAYPGARLEEAEDYNIFNPTGRIPGTFGGELSLKSDSAYPLATYRGMERDPMEALLNVLSGLSQDDGVGVQIMLRPADSGWVKRAHKVADKKRKGKESGVGITPMDLAKAAVKAPSAQNTTAASPNGAVPQPAPPISGADQNAVESIEEKATHPVFEVLIRIVTSSTTATRSQQILKDVVSTFSLFDAPGLNGFKLVEASNIEGLVTAFIFRFFPPELNHDVLNSVELATIFHLPDSQYTPSSQVQRQSIKEVDGPVTVPTTGLLLGYNMFRGVKKEIRLSPEDRRRHTYIVGQTGTGKSTLLENLMVQDMRAGNGFAFIDPHGDTAERLLGLVPKERAEDIIYFNPADTKYPLGLNLFEFQTPQQKDFLIQEAIGMLYRLYDPGHTGIIGPRYEHWFRNAALTLMSDPEGATFIEIPKVFTDTEYLKKKFKHVQDPTVIDFWTQEMAATSDYHKSEMLGWFVSKFGAFQSNEMMRNIIGQTKSAFNFREVMDNRKILIVNLSKGRVGELNSELLGMMLVTKFQVAAMSRAEVPEDQRKDFCLYVDEFQNFSTDSFASILSEARKYRLNLIVANQFIGQLSDEIREAVFGNVGSVMSFRSGPEDADFLVKQFAPVFDARDLVRLPNYQAVIRLMIGGLPTQPFSLSTLPPGGSPNPELLAAVKQLSAAKFGVDKIQVEADIARRLKALPTDPVVPVAPPPAKPPQATSSQPVQATASQKPVTQPAQPAPQPAPQPATPPQQSVSPVPQPPVQSTQKPVQAPVQVSTPVHPKPQQPKVVAQDAPAPDPLPKPAAQEPPSSKPQTVSSDTLHIGDIVKGLPQSPSKQPAVAAQPQPPIQPKQPTPTPPKPIASQPATQHSAEEVISEEIQEEGLEGVIKIVMPVSPSQQTPQAPTTPPPPPADVKPLDPFETVLNASGAIHVAPEAAPKPIQQPVTPPPTAPAPTIPTQTPAQAPMAAPVATTPPQSLPAPTSVPAPAPVQAPQVSNPVPPVDQVPAQIPTQVPSPQQSPPAPAQPVVPPAAIPPTPAQPVPPPNPVQSSTPAALPQQEPAQPLSQSQLPPSFNAVVPASSILGEKPDPSKLKPGEVYVDENGNVVQAPAE